MSGSPKFKFIALRRAGIAWHLTFNRPDRRNALNHPMMVEIGQAVDMVAVDKNCRALVLRGAGGAFCAGGDLAAMADMPAKPKKGPDPLVRSYRQFGDALLKLNNLPQAVVAVVEGPAVGGGFGMACCSDVVILHASAKFGIPEPRSGFIPSQIIPFLVRRLGEGAVRHLAVTGTIMDAPAAERLGLGHFLCATAKELDAALAGVLANIGKMEPDAMATSKRLAMMCARAGDVAVMDRAGEELVRLLRRKQAKAGMQAFLTKKAPPWAV